MGRIRQFVSAFALRFFGVGAVDAAMARARQRIAKEEWEARAAHRRERQ